MFDEAKSLRRSPAPDVVAPLVLEQHEKERSLFVPYIRRQQFGHSGAFGSGIQCDGSASKKNPSTSEYQLSSS